MYTVLSQSVGLFNISQLPVRSSSRLCFHLWLSSYGLSSSLRPHIIVLLVVHRQFIGIATHANDSAFVTLSCANKLLSALERRLCLLTFIIGDISDCGLRDKQSVIICRTYSI